jgi:hypothetical protein
MGIEKPTWKQELQSILKKSRYRLKPSNTSMRKKEKTLFQYDEVAINAGQRGIMLIMKPKDILRASDGIGADLI